MLTCGRRTEGLVGVGEASGPPTSKDTFLRPPGSPCTTAVPSASPSASPFLSAVSSLCIGLDLPSPILTTALSPPYFVSPGFTRVVSEFWRESDVDLLVREGSLAPILASRTSVTPFMAWLAVDSCLTPAGAVSACSLPLWSPCPLLPSSSR